MTNAFETNDNPHIETSTHPERNWLILTNKENWRFRGLLTFKKPHLALVENFRIKKFFSEYNLFLNGIGNYRPVPVIWRFEHGAKNEGLHIHYMMLESFAGFHTRHGELNQFSSDYRLNNFLNFKWKNVHESHGMATMRKFTDQKEIDFWLKYITKSKNTDGTPCDLLKTHFTPPIENLKRQILAGNHTTRCVDDNADHPYKTKIFPHINGAELNQLSV